jgi:hypothetical protein
MLFSKLSTAGQGAHAQDRNPRLTLHRTQRLAKVGAVNLYRVLYEHSDELIVLLAHLSPRNLRALCRTRYQEAPTRLLFALGLSFHVQLAA